MKLKICLLGLLCLFFRLSAYSTGPAPGLKIGDKVPDFLITQIINYPTRTAKISDFKDKVLLLDFWATWCSSCIQNFPKTYALQQKFPNSLQVLLVNSKSTRDIESSIQDFLNKRKKQYHFPCAVMDTCLAALFPHGTVPHYVLIKNNIVMAITDAGEINEANIKAFIDDRSVSLHVKTEPIYNPNKPIAAASGESGRPVLFSSLLTGYTDIRSGAGYKLTGGMFTGFHFVNGPVLQLYFFANPSFVYPKDRMIFNVAKPEELSLDSNSYAYKVKYFYTYESIYPPRKKPEALVLLREDLDRYFHLKLDSSYRDTDCYVLTLNSKLLPKKVEEKVVPSTNIDEKSGGPVYYINEDIDQLCSYLEEEYKVPFINETGYRNKVSLDLPADYTTSEALISCLPKQGFILTKAKRRISFLVVSEIHQPK